MADQISIMRWNNRSNSPPKYPIMQPSAMPIRSRGGFTVTELMVGSARNHNLKLSASVADNVPQVVRGDPIRLRQVLINLVENSVKFGRRCDRRKITVRVASTDGHVEIAVADTGPGIDQRAGRRIFEPFFTTKEPGHGTGLGLSICQEIVRRLGGEIAVVFQDPMSSLNPVFRCGDQIAEAYGTN